MRTLFLSTLATSLLLTGIASAQSRQPDPEIVAAPPVSGPLEYIPQPFDVLHYDADIDLTKAPSREMSGVCRAMVLWSGDPQSGPYYFHLRGLHVDSAFYNDTRVDAAAKEDTSSPTYHYEITPLPSTKRGDTVMIAIYYSGTMTSEPKTPSWGGVLSSGGTLYAMGVGFNNNYVSATQHWLPCYDHPSDKATLHLRVTVPKDYQVASNGLLISVIGVVFHDGRSVATYEWSHDIPCATYLYTFAVDKYLPVQFGDSLLPMQVWARAEDTVATRTSFKLLPKMVAAWEKYFGKYPFEKVGYVLTPTGSMEHETMISYYKSLIGSDTVNSTAAHELSHQWFGDLVTPLDFRHAWLNESFATFCESLWAGELGGYAAYLQSESTKLSSYLNNYAKSEGIFPLYDFPRTPPSSNYPVTIYYKGAVVVGMLRYEIGDSIFFTGLRDYLARHAYGNVTTEDLRAVLEEHAGRSLKWFFDQWVYGKGWPELMVHTTSQPNGDGSQRVQLTVAQTQPLSYGIYTNLPVEVGFRASDGSTAYRLLRITDQQQTFTLDSIPAFTLIRINQGPTVRPLLKVTSISGVAGAAPDSGEVQFKVRPNPAANVATLTVEVKGSTDCSGIQYELYDTAGKRILVGSNDACTFTIPIENFISGAYVLRFKFKSTFYDVPVVIEH